MNVHFYKDSLGRKAKNTIKVEIMHVLHAISLKQRQSEAIFKTVYEGR